MTEVVEVNETARAFARGKVEGVSFSLMVLQMHRDSTESSTRRKVICDMIESLAYAEVKRTTRKGAI